MTPPPLPLALPATLADAWVCYRVRLSLEDGGLMAWYVTVMRFFTLTEEEWLAAHRFEPAYLHGPPMGTWACAWRLDDCVRPRGGPLYDSAPWRPGLLP